MKHRFYYFLLIINCLSNLELYFPFLLLINARNGIIFALIIALILATLYAYMLLFVFNKYKNKNFVDICKTLYGKKFGSMIGLLYALLRLAVAGFLFAGAVKGMRLYLLPETPIWYISLLLSFALYIVTKQSRRNYLHCKAFLSLIIIPLTIFIFIIGLRNMDYNYLKGSLIHSFHMPKLTMITSSLLFFTGVQHLSVFNTLFKKKLSLKNTLIIYYAIGIPFAIISLAIPLGVWGPEAIKTLKFVETITTDTMSIDLFFIERVLFLAAPLLCLIIILDIANYSYIGFELLKDLGASRKIYKASIFTAFLIFTVFVMFIGPAERLYYAASPFGIIWFAIHSSIVLLLFIGAKLKRGGKN